MFGVLNVMTVLTVGDYMNDDWYYTRHLIEVLSRLKLISVYNTLKQNKISYFIGKYGRRNE